MARGISTHIGINEVDPDHYAGWSGPLQACEADARDMQRIAQESGFETSTTLTKQATRDNVRASIQSASEALAPGDIFFVSYSGHGGQVPDLDGDERTLNAADVQDETWCLYDGELIDDELLELWSQFRRGVRVLVLSDSCHSGTVLRSMREADAEIPNELFEDNTAPGGMRYRYLPSDVARATYRQNRGFYNAIIDRIRAQFDPPGGEPPDIASHIEATVRLISGCQDDQFSLDGTFNGLFTGQLLRVWDDGDFSGNYDDLHSGIQDLMPSDQTPNHMTLGPASTAYDAERPFTV